MTTREPDINPSDRFNTVQAAKVLGISRTTLWRLTNKGILRPRYEKHTLKARYRGKDLLAFWRAEI